MTNSHFHKELVKFVWDLLAILFVVWGIFALLTPLTPGSWLFFVGLVIIFGRKRTQKVVFHMLGRTWFKKLKIKKILEKVPTTVDEKL